MYILLIILFSRFVGGELNTCYNCVDRHVENGFGHQTAIIHDSPVTNVIHKLSYQELLEQVLLLYYYYTRAGAPTISKSGSVTATLWVVMLKYWAVRGGC